MLALLWAVVVVLVLYVQKAQQDLAPFDPYAILELSNDATEQEVKTSYRKLALKYHPDKVIPFAFCMCVLHFKEC